MHHQKSSLCVIGNNGFMFGRAFGHSSSALTSWPRLLNPAPNPSLRNNLHLSHFPSFSICDDSASVSAWLAVRWCARVNRRCNWYWQLTDRILNYYSRVRWLADLGSVLSRSMLPESFSSSVNIEMHFCSLHSRHRPPDFEFKGECKWNA